MNDSLENPSEFLLRYTVRTALLLALIGNSAAFYVQLQVGWRDGMFLGYMLVPIFLGLVILEKRLSFKIRAWTYLLSFTAFFVGSLLSLGFLSAYHGLAIFLPTTAIVFLGFRAAVIETLLCLSGYLLMLSVVGGADTSVQVSYEDLISSTTHKIFYATVYAISSAATIVLFYTYVRTLKRVAAENRALADYNSALIEAFSDAPDMLALWDQQDRLIFINNHMANLCLDLGTPAPLGISFEDYIKNVLSESVLNGEEVDPAELCNTALEYHRKSGWERTYALANGQWHTVRNSVTSGGMVASFTTDITDLKTAERRLKFIVDCISERILTLDEHGVITFANAGVSQSFGYHRDQLIGMRFSQLVVSVADDQLNDLLGSYSEENLEPELRLSNAKAENRDGESFNVGVRLGVARHSEESIIIVVLQDYSLLDTGEARVHAMFDAVRQIDVGFLLVDGSGRIYFSNDEMESMFGERAFEPGASFQDAVSLLGSTGLIESVNDSPDSPPETAWLLEGSNPVVNFAVLSDGRYIRLVGQPISNEAQMWICSDDTDARVKNMQLQQAAKLASLGEMAAGIAHEINQPLNVIRLAASNLQRSFENGQVDLSRVLTKLERINDQTERAAFIINQLRDYGRDAKEQDVASDPIASVINVESMLGEQLRLEGIDFSVSIDVPSANVMIHPTKLEQVLVALINNARDAALSSAPIERRSPAVSIRVMAINGGDIAIDVSDTGGGVSLENIDKVFEPFFTTKDIGKGTGLGLSVSYNIIKEAGGVLSYLDSSDGAIFRIRLPEA